ncbi:caspase, EACC1-associated type, partial [Streptomyces spongiae]|nr:caspase family protein [Streptomyces spongiae]
MRLPDSQRSFAILIGTSRYESSDLADLPAVRNNLDDLAAILTDPAIGWLPPRQCTVIVDPPDPRTLYRTLRQRAQAAEDTLLVYFAGHGQTGPRNDLFLALAATELDELKVSALAFDLLRDVLADCPATNRVLILDCCFRPRPTRRHRLPDRPRPPPPAQALTGGTGHGAVAHPAGGTERPRSPTPLERSVTRCTSAVARTPARVPTPSGYRSPVIDSLVLAQGNSRASTATCPAVA